ncbi:KTSC domain-containing protein [Entomohabitans teleogrylli]|uniref:KTSC domain-containing protein n=1 Tax=Entomohabitans teleogrylli TaxID=1384589 RepID=UPI00073D5A2F|nr:KTSC domain-containing protein [Entomohabitans teleogrylli]
MRHQPVKSSRIASVAYNPRTSTLEVYFLDKSLWEYRQVPERVFHDFLRVVSKGRFYDGVIKGKYPERQLG